MMCPVCLTIVGVHNGGVTDEHWDTAGHKCAMSGQPAFEWDEKSTREAVPNRSHGYCEYCGKARATEMHHRKGRGVGGKWSPANILHMCAKDHRYFTEYREDGYQLGVLVHGYADPEDIPVTMYDGMRLWLTDDVAPPTIGRL